MFLLPNKQMDSDQPWSISAGTQAYSCAEQRPLSRSRAGLSALTAQLRSLGNFNSSYECPHTPWTLNEQLRLRARRQQRERGEWYKKRLLRIHSGMKGPRGGGGRVTEYTKELKRQVETWKPSGHICTRFLSACPKPGRPWIPSLIPWSTIHLVLLKIFPSPLKLAQQHLPRSCYQ